MTFDYYVRGLDGEQSSAALPIAIVGVFAGAALSGGMIAKSEPYAPAPGIVWERSLSGLSGLYSIRPTFRSDAETAESTARTELGRQLRAIRARIVASGADLMDWDQVTAEVARRRGEIR